MDEELAFPGTDDGRTVAEVDAYIKAENAANLTTNQQEATMHLKDLPAISQPLAAGVFAGLTTTPDGQHCAVVLLPNKPNKLLTWQEAGEWAASVGGVLPTRPVSALLFALLRSDFETDNKPWYWTSEQSSDRYAWIQTFDGGGSQDGGDESAQLRARAVRLIQLSA
jgi:hypothetical protein